MTAAPLRLLLALHPDEDEQLALLPVTADLARRLLAEVHVVQVIDSPEMRALPAIAAPVPAALTLAHAVEPAVAPEAIHDTVLTRLHDAVTASEGLTGIAWTAHVLAGPAVEQIVQLADELDAYLIVIGTPRRGLAAAWTHLVDGSVARELTHRTHRPVLLVPDP